MALVEFKEIDCGVPYKKFQELKDNDIIYMIDYETLSIKDYKVKDVNVEKVKEYDRRKNCYEVNFKIIDFDNEYSQCISNGNCFINRCYYNGIGTYFTTDKRIGDIILEILRERNHYQWEAFNKIFNHRDIQKYNDIKYA